MASIGTKGAAHNANKVGLNTKITHTSADSIDNGFYYSCNR
ncbi:Uncharacterised protein [Vibrio cholerae]|nr:Uncharacterised protein [Vibrio cholerae]